MIVLDSTDSSAPISAYLAEALLLAQEIIKNPQVSGAAKSQISKQSASTTYIETIKYTVGHDAVIKLPNGEVDISQLPHIHITVSSTVDPAGSGPTGTMSIDMGYSGEIISAYGSMQGDDADEQIKLTPADAFIIVKEAVAAVKAYNQQTAVA